MRTALIYFDKSGAVYMVASLIGTIPEEGAYSPDVLVRGHWDDHCASAVACWGTDENAAASYASKP